MYVSALHQCTAMRNITHTSGSGHDWGRNGSGGSGDEARKLLLLVAVSKGREFGSHIILHPMLGDVLFEVAGCACDLQRCGLVCCTSVRRWRLT